LGESNIDLAICSPSLVRKVSTWCVNDEFSVSDHRLISFHIGSSGNKTRTATDTVKFNIGAANWEKYAEELFNQTWSACENIIWEPSIDNINVRVKALSDAVVHAARQSIPRISSRPNSVPWWNKKLHKLKLRCRNLRRTLQRCRDDADKGIHLRRYTEAKKEYQDYTQKCKFKAWNKFAANDLATNPWGLVHKLSREKLRSPQTLSSRNRDDGKVQLTKETIANLPKSLIPGDSEEEETIEEKEIRFNANIIGNTRNTVISSEDVTTAT
jgi:hypothetical protein